MAAETRKSRKSNFSQEEIDVLITTVMQNHNILYGETSKSFFHKEIRNQVWNIILEEVNKVSLERRTLNEVKNKWKKCQYNLRAADHAETVDYVDCDDLDSMPLQQRLSQNHNEPSPTTPNQEPVLQSQPISPTKLKVTRQGAKPQQPPAKPPTPPPPNPEVCLRWNSHHMNMQSAFPSLLTKEQYVDATLVSEGKTLKCHRMILSSCSPYFEEVLEGIGPFQHPVLFMKDTPFWILKALCDFMYAGEVHIFQDKLQELLNVAEALKIKGLAGNSDAKEEVKPVVPQIKQEIEAVSPPRILETPLKQEKEDEPPPAPKPTKHETVKPSKKKERLSSKHSAQTHKEKVFEEPPPKVAPKINQKVALPKVAPKVIPKVILPKIPVTPKTAVKNVMKNVLQKVPRPSTSKTTHASRKGEASRKIDKHKADGPDQKDKEKFQEKDRPPLKKDNINDPLDLLQPVYEEIAKEDPPSMMKCINPAKLKERGNMLVRKGVTKKVKKRRYAEYAEEREESPPPVFSSRKGTRSRPHVKIPKFFHTHYEETQKETIDATIVREPHTDQSDPLIGVEEVEEIKAEPLDVEENTMELENYMHDQEMTYQEGEEIIGNYDSPIVNIKREGVKRNTPNIFKKMLDSQPVIMNVHTVTEGSQTGVRLLNINEDTLKIVDIAKISTGQNRIEETIIATDIYTMDAQEKTSEIMISNVQSMAEICEDNRSKESEVCTEGAVMPSESEARFLENEDVSAENICAEVRLESTLSYAQHPIESSLRVSEELFNTSQSIPESEASLMETNQVSFRIKVEHIRSENSQDCGDLVTRPDETELDSTAIGSLAIQEPGTLASASLGSLEDRLGACDIESQEVEGQSSAQTFEGGNENLPQRVEHNIHATQDEVDQNEGPEHAWSNSEALGDNAKPIQLTAGSQEMMSVGSENGDNHAPDTYEAAYNAEEKPDHYSSENIHNRCHDESIEKTAKREGIFPTEIRGAKEPYVDNVDRDKIDRASDINSENAIAENTSGSCGVNYTSGVFPQLGDENVDIDGIPESSSEPFVEPIPKTSEQSEDAMSVGIVSQEVTFISTERELETNDNLHLERTAEDVPQSGFDRDMTASVSLNSDVLPSTTETETFQNTTEETNFTVQESGDPKEENVWNNDSRNLQTNSDTNTGMDVCEEGLISHESEVTELVDNIQNTPEIMSLDSQSHNTVQDVNKATCTAQVSETPDEVRNRETEINNQEVEESCVENAAPTAQLSLVVTPVDDNVAEVSTEESEKDISKQMPENIGAELEQCLASTSDIVPKKIGEEKSGTERLSFEDEDFTKDIEFDNFIERNKPPNYLADDLNEDFEMEDVEATKCRNKSGENENGNARLEDGNACSNMIETEEGEGVCAFAEAAGDKRVVNEDRLAESDNKHASCNNLVDNLVRTDEISSSKEHLSTDAHEDNLDHEKITNTDQTSKVGHILDLSKNAGLPLINEHSVICQNTADITENLNEHHRSSDEDQKLEDSLLADDDVEMKEASTSEQSEDGAEKTLEMIVNDLNESLGELRK